MKRNMVKLVIISAFIAVFSVGCAFSQKLPSVTLGGAANKESVLDASAGKSGVSVTAPLVNVDVPFPTLKGTEE
jgi:hypothetical protein|tara:strand:- start:1061 stop:1282 length:222 start_codon:yes stop_codon:yes gene_type:complete